MALVGAAWLAQLLVAAGHVEDVVDDLKEDARARRRSAGRVGRGLAQAGRAPAPAPTLAAIRRPVFSECSSRRVAASVPPPVTSTYWPPTIPSTPVAAGDLADRREHPRRLTGLAFGDQSHRLGEQRVAGEDRHVLTVDYVGGRATAPHVVVVHRRQVVVDQRVGVDQAPTPRRSAAARTGRYRASDRWRDRGPAGCACRPQAASSASPPAGRRSRPDRRS